MNCEILKKGGFACEEFWQVVQEDLNGSFHCKYTIDEEGEMIGHGQLLSLRSIACYYSNLSQNHGAASKSRRLIRLLHHQRLIMAGSK